MNNWGGLFLARAEYLLEEQVKTVLALLTPENRLVMRTVLHTGLRVSDVLTLKTEDLQPKMRVKEAKTGKYKTIGLPASLLADIKDQAGDEWAFPGRFEGHRSRQTVWKDMKRAAAACRLPQNIGTHSGRKVYAVRLMQKYGDIERVRKLLNHDYSSVTLLYAMADLLLEQKYKLPRRKDCP